MQPVVRADSGVARFKSNAIVHWMLAFGRMGLPFDLNAILSEEFSTEDLEQLVQLLGYSLQGFEELSFVRQESVFKARAGESNLEEREQTITQLEQRLSSAERLAVGLAELVARHWSTRSPMRGLPDNWWELAKSMGAKEP